ncbi:MAG: hypothetical protein ACQCN3_10470 [Candidatus Bathyarchaeia archaeon]|jgi:hypothetical protein
MSEEKAKRKQPIENNEAIKNLLVISLLKDGVNPKVIETATGIPEKTIRNKFPMNDIKPSRGKSKDVEVIDS